MKHKIIKSRFAFTLVETLVVLMIAAMIVTSVMMIYQRVRGSAVTIMDYMYQTELQDEILQRIAEDIDRLAAPGFEASIKFVNKTFDGKYNGAQLILENNYYGRDDKKQTYEQIIWRAGYDSEDDAMILYRMHDGLNVEDKVLEKNADDSPSAGLFIPIASGVTFFELRTQQGQSILSAWTSEEKMPAAVQIGISFAPLEQWADGSISVPEESISYRTVAIDRTRMIPYQFVKKELNLDALDDETDDPNDLLTSSETEEGEGEDEGSTAGPDDTDQIE